MPNPVFTKDLLQDDGAISAGIKQLQDLSKEYEKFIGTVQAQSVKLEATVRRSNVSSVAQRENLRETAKEVDQLDKEYSKYVDLLGKNAIKIAALKNGQQQLNKVNKLEATILSAKNGSMEQLNAQLKLNQTRLGQMTEAQKASTKEGFKLTEQTERMKLRVKELKDEQKKALQIRALEKKVNDSAEGSYDQRSAQYSLLKIKLNAMSLEQRKNTKEGQLMEKQSAAVYDEMKKLQEVTGKHTLNVGNYTNSIVSAFKRQKELSSELKKTKKEFNELPESVKKSDEAQKEHAETTFILTSEMETLSEVTGKTAKEVEDLSDSNGSLLDNVSALPGALGAAGGGVKGLGSNFKALLANPVVLTIGLIVGGLYALFNAFKQSEKGVALMTKATGFLNGIWSQVISLTDSIASGLESLFTDPIGSLKSFGKSIIDNVYNRFVAIADIGGAIGKILKGIFTLDTDTLKEGLEDAATAAIKLSTGLDEQQQKDFAAAVSETTKKVNQQTQSFVDLEVAKRSVANSNREVEKSIQKLITSEQIYLSIADDNTKSFKEREDAAEKARKATEARSKKEITVAKNNLGLINTELDLRRATGQAVDALLDQQLSAYKELKGAERDYSLSVRDSEKTRDELKQDRLERDLDILIDGFDNQKTINEKLIQDETKTFEERKKLFDETVLLSDGSFNKQIETLQKFTGVKLDADELINESDAVALNQRIRSLGLSEIIEGRLLEVIRDRKTAIQDLSEAEKELAESGRSGELDTLGNQQELASLEFDLVKRSEIEKSEFALKQKQETLDKTNELNKKFETVLPPIDTAKIKVQIKQLENEIRNAKRESAIVQFDDQQELAQSEFDLLKTSEKDKTIFRLNAERERLLKILQLNEQFGKEMTDLQKQIVVNQVAAINNEIGKIKNGGGFNIYETLGFNLNDEQQQAMSESFQYAAGQLTEFAAQRTQLADQNVQQSNNEVQSAENALQVQVENQRAGTAHKVDTATKELELAKKQQKEALNERRKAQRAELAIQTVQQASNLVTASTKIWATLGFPWALPALGVMWGSFIASKVRATQLTKKQLGKGALTFIGGGSHASGNDTPLGFAIDGQQAYGEKDEAHMVLRKQRSRQYKSVLPQIFKSLDKGTFEADFMSMNQSHTDMPIFNVQNSSNTAQTDMSSIEGYLQELIEKTSTPFTKDANGNLVKQHKNVMTTYV